MLSTIIILSGLFFFGLATASKPNYCPLLGPVFPPPSHLNKSLDFSAAVKNISTVLEQAVKGDSRLSSVIDPNATSFTLQIFNAKDQAPLFEFYHTSPAVQDYKEGVKSIDENTVFRIGSGSKLITTLLLLIEKGDSVFNEPVARYIPEIREAVAELRANTTNQNNAIDFLRWGEVTVGELCSHMSGLQRDYGLADIATTVSNPGQYGLPTLPKTEIPPCGSAGTCNRTELFRGLMSGHPIVPTGSTPVYSNAAFQIVGYVIEALTGQSYQSVLSKDLIEPLSLSGFSYSAPKGSEGIVPSKKDWAFPAREQTPAGGLYSSIKDMASIGRALLQDTLIPADLRIRWMKPVTHTGSLELSVGAPWEIYSYQLNSRVVDFYTKAGDLDGYSSMLALSPEYEVGFTILAAGEGTTTTDLGTTVGYLSDVIGGTIIPALEAAAKAEAKSRFEGVYKSSNRNATITIKTDSGPGLRVTKWVSGGKDMFKSFEKLNGIVNSVRLFPTGLVNTNGISFRAIIQDLTSVSGIGPFTRSCKTWQRMDQIVYGNIGLDEFVFTLDGHGNGKTLLPRGLREELIRIE